MQAGPLHIGEVGRIGRIHTRKHTESPVLVLTKHALISTFPICMEGQIRFPLAGSAVGDRAETFRISPPNTDVRKVGPGACDVLWRPKKGCRQAILARRLPTPGWHATDQVGKVELIPGPPLPLPFSLPAEQPLPPSPRLSATLRRSCGRDGHFLDHG